MEPKVNALELIDYVDLSISAIAQGQNLQRSLQFLAMSVPWQALG